MKDRSDDPSHHERTTTELHLATDLPERQHQRLCNSSMGSPWRIDPTTHRTMSELPRSYTSLLTCQNDNIGVSAIAQWDHHEGSIRRPIALWANATSRYWPARTTTSASLSASRRRCLAWTGLCRPSSPRDIPPRKHGIPRDCNA